MKTTSSKSFRLLLASCVVWLFALGSAMAAPLYFPTTGSYYDVYFGKLTWSDARAAAESMSHLGITGRLATITSQQEDDFVANNLLDNVYATGNSYWLGASQVTTNGLPLGPNEGWQWITGETWDYANWEPGAPNDQGPEHCLEMYGTGKAGMWNDLANNDVGNSEGFVIEYTPVPEPSSLALVGLGAVALMVARRRK